MVSSTPAAREYPHVDEGAAAGAQRVRGERGDERGSGQEGKPGGGGGEAAAAGRLADAVGQGDDAGRQQEETGRVEPVTAPARGGGQQPGAERERGQADRDVHQEEPPPVRPSQQDAAQHRAEDRAEQARQPDGEHRLVEAVGPGRLGEDRHGDRDDHAADPLHHPEGHQRGQ
nr:hypothetical protein [Actinomadura fibrosa]